jgi:hypothetical protein
MQGLFRRPSGVYFLRISVPISLRPIFEKREVIASTGTTELAIAKLVAGAEAAQWRQRFFDAGRLSSLAGTFMTNDQELIRIAQGHPTLHSGGHLTVTEAATACGLSPTVLLGEAAESRLSLFVRTGGTGSPYLSREDQDTVVRRARRCSAAARHFRSMHSTRPTARELLWYGWQGAGLAQPDVGFGAKQVAVVRKAFMPHFGGIGKRSGLVGTCLHGLNTGVWWMLIRNSHSTDGNSNR